MKFKHKPLRYGHFFLTSHTRKWDGKGKLHSHTHMRCIKSSDWNGVEENKWNQPLEIFLIRWKHTGVRRKFRIRDKKTESPYLVHPLTYRQVYLTKDAYFVEKIHCELVEMAVGQRMNKIRFSCHNIYGLVTSKTSDTWFSAAHESVDLLCFLFSTDFFPS